MTQNLVYDSSMTLCELLIISACETGVDGV